MKLDIDRVFELAHSIIDRYVHEEIDSVYIVYNEFKSVIAQRVVVEKLLPLIKLGYARRSPAPRRPTAEERLRAAEAARTAGIELEEADTREADEEAKKFGTAEVDYIYEQPPEELFAASCRSTSPPALPRHGRVGRRRARRPHDGDGFGNQQCLGYDRCLTLTMNRVRQAAITKEIIEIVSGAAAL